MALKTGIVALVLVVKHACRILTTWRTAINGVVNAAVSSNVITSTQRDILNTWLDGAQTACNILRTITDY